MHLATERSMTMTQDELDYENFVARMGSFDDNLDDLMSELESEVDEQ